MSAAPAPSSMAAAPATNSMAGTAPAAPTMDAASIQALANAIWPVGSGSPVGALRRAAVSVLLKQVPGVTNVGPYSILASTFRQALSTADPHAYAACQPFEGSKVKTVLVGAEAVFKAKYVPGETSKAIVLDVEGLKTLAADPSQATEWTPPPGSVPAAPPAPPSLPPSGPVHSAPAKGGASRGGAAAHQAAAGGPSVPPLGPGEMPSNRELSLCMMAMATYRPQNASDHLAVLRCKLACLLARVPEDAQQGPHTLLGTHLGDALGKYASEAWQALPSAGSRLQRLADSCLLVEQTPAGVAMRLDTAELERMATAAAVHEWRSLGPVPGAGKRQAGAAPAPAAAAAPAGHGDVAWPSGGGNWPAVPANVGLDVSGSLPPPRDDDYGLAICAASISVWCPNRWHIAAAVLAMLGQQGQVAQRNGGRHCSHIGFFLKEVQRVAAMIRAPAADIGTKQLAASEPLLTFNTTGAPGGLVTLQVVGLAQHVLAAAKQGPPPDGTSRPGPRWPPEVHELPVAHLHTQAQPLVRHLVHVLSGADGPAARTSLLARCVAQLEALAAFGGGAGAGTAPATPPQQPGVPGNQQAVTAAAVAAAQAAAQQHQAAHMQQAQQAQQAAALAAAQAGQQAQTMLMAGAAASQLIAVQQQLAAAQGAPKQATLGQAVGSQVAQLLAHMFQTMPPDVQQPLHRLIQRLTLAYPNMHDAASLLRRTAALRLAISPNGPLGPHSMPLADLCHLLRNEEPASWQAVFGNGADANSLRDTITLLNNAPGFALRPGAAYEVVVQLDLASLERAALTAAQNSAPMAFVGNAPSGQVMMAGSPVMAVGPGGQQVMVQSAGGQQVLVSAQRAAGQPGMMSMQPGAALTSHGGSGLNAMAPSFQAPFGAPPAGMQPQQLQQHTSGGSGTGSLEQRASITGIGGGGGGIGGGGGTAGAPRTTGAAPGAPSPSLAVPQQGNDKGWSTPAGSSYGNGGAAVSSYDVAAQNTAGSGVHDARGTAGTPTANGEYGGGSGGGLMSTLTAAIGQHTASGTLPSAGGMGQGGGGPHAAAPGGPWQEEEAGVPSPAELAQLASAAFPGHSAVNVVRRAAVQLLADTPTGPAGPRSMDGPALGLALAKLEPEAYKALPCSAQGKLRLRAVCEGTPVFGRIQAHQTQVCIKLVVPELQRAAAAGGAGEGGVTPGGGATVTAAAICARWRGAAGGARTPAAEALQVRLTNCADALYAPWDPLRDLKLHAVHLLAGCVASGGESPDAGSGRERPLGNFSMMGPEFGNAMSRRVPNQWSSVPGSKLAKLCQSDPFLHVRAAGDNRAICLDVDALQAAAGEGAGTAAQGAQAVPGTQHAAPQPPPPPAPTSTVGAAVAAASAALGQRSGSSTPKPPPAPSVAPQPAMRGIGVGRIQLNPAACDFAPASRGTAAPSVAHVIPARSPPPAPLGSSAGSVGKGPLGAAANGSAAVPIPVVRPGSAGSGDTMGRGADGMASIYLHARSPAASVGRGSSQAIHDSIHTSLPHSLGSGVSYGSADRGELPLRPATAGPSVRAPGALPPPRAHHVGGCGDASDSALEGALQTQEAALMHLITE